MEYRFNDFMRYDSCEFVREKRYSINADVITKEDLRHVFNSTRINDETYGAPFIQCDSFSKIINIIEVLSENQYIKESDIVELFGFTPRQGNYYFNGCRYLNLVEKGHDGTITLTDRGRLVTRATYKQRQLFLVSYMIEHRIFNHWLLDYLSGHTPDKDRIRNLMRAYNVCGESLINRRSSTVAAWLSWIINLTDE